MRIRRTNGSTRHARPFPQFHPLLPKGAERDQGGSGPFPRRRGVVFFAKFARAPQTPKRLYSEPTMDRVQTKTEIEHTLAAMGRRPQKRFGQHFLVDGNLMRRLVECAELTPDDVVLEVGPGTGGLTDLLVPKVRRVIAVEIDRTLHAILEDRFRDAANFSLIFGDVLDGKHQLAAPVLTALGDEPTAPIKLVANLPYQVATPLILNLLVHFPRVRRYCFTVQAEVGTRITASPGGRDFGPLGILCQSLCTIATVARLRPQCFWPAPHVDSVMLRLDVRDRALVPRERIGDFAEFVRGVFDHRRKQLRAAMSYTIAEHTLAALPDRFNLTRRPEQLAIDEWYALYQAIHS